MTPEIKILILNAVTLGIAYLGIYPSMREKTLAGMMRNDLVLTGLAVIVAGALFMGTGTRFGLIWFSTNWLVFSLVTLMIMEIPLFMWFCRRHGIDLNGGQK
ncbi:MAG: hypothetical protein Q4G25_10340 [Paracoccus sp. (in: a-proteobacteria)]|nr:hypothetical protein [Paracoccus sp. (in: a-proteobacteria)]